MGDYCFQICEGLIGVGMRKSELGISICVNQFTTYGIPRGISFEHDCHPMSGIGESLHVVGIWKSAGHW